SGSVGTSNAATTIARAEFDQWASAGMFLSKVRPSPLAGYDCWLNFTFATALISVTRPDLAEEAREIWNAASQAAGGAAENNDEHFDRALKSTAKRIQQSEPVVGLGSTLSLARDAGWRPPRRSSDVIDETGERASIPSGWIEPDIAIDLMNAWYFVA